MLCEAQMRKKKMKSSLKPRKNGALNGKLHQCYLRMLCVETRVENESLHLMNQLNSSVHSADSPKSNIYS